MLFAYLKRILRLDRFAFTRPKRARDEFPFGRHRPKSEETGEDHHASGARSRHMRRREGLGFASPATTSGAHRHLRSAGTSTLSVDCRRLLFADIVL
jgi:hypothetical protein